VIEALKLATDRQAIRSGGAGYGSIGRQPDRAAVQPVLLGGDLYRLETWRKPASCSPKQVTKMG
jgi:hypothetical protein